MQTQFGAMSANDKPINNKVKIAIAVFASFCGLIVFVVIVGVIFIRNAPKSTGLQAINVAVDPASAREQFNGVIAVPNEIWMSYEKNRRAADSVYQFQQVRLFGRVSKVGRDVVHAYPQIVFAAKGKRSSGEVLCVFDTSSSTDQRRAASIKPGDQVEIAGTCGGIQGDRVILLECRIQQQ